MKGKFIGTIVFVLFGCAVCRGQEQKTTYYEAPYQLNILQNKGAKRGRFREIRGHFQRVKIEFTNTDRTAHRLDYSCFYLVDALGFEYNVHFDATLAKESEVEDWFVSENREIGFLQERIAQPLFPIRGYLLFEVPKSGDYTVKFRGYKYINKP